MRYRQDQLMNIQKLNIQLVEALHNPFYLKLKMEGGPIEFGISI